MPTSLNVKSSITVNAPATKVWEALTRPELIKQWFFGVETVTDWKVGSPIVHKGMWKDKPYEDKGTILKIEPPNLLAHSHWSALSNLPDRPENYQNVTYALAAHNGSTDLTITEGNIPTEEARAQSEKSWKSVLTSLKEMLEK